MQALYDRKYYLSDCEGHREFIRTHGRKLSRRLNKCNQLLAARSGEHIADLGCGRGEIALHAAACGAHVVAVDASNAALQLLDEATQMWRESNVLPQNLSGSVKRVTASLEKIPIEDSTMNAVVMSDVIEHIPRANIGDVLAECYRILKPGGRIIIHTQPNRILVDWTVPVLSKISWLWGTRLPRDLREEMTPGARGEYHPSEQSRRELAGWLRRAGFGIEQLWLEGSYPIHRIFGNSGWKQLLLPLFRRQRWIKEIFASQLFAVAHKSLKN